MNNLNPKPAPTAHVCKYEGRSGLLLQERDIITPVDLYLDAIKSLWSVVTITRHEDGTITGETYRSKQEHAAGFPLYRYTIKPLTK